MEKYEKLIGQIRKLYWDQEKGAFIDSFESGKRNVTRHAANPIPTYRNIFDNTFNTL